jgi:hypothetical protein
MKSIYLQLVLACVSVKVQAQNLNLRINEVLARNQTNQMDDFFEYDDWVEIYNPPGNPITNLAGYYISDDPDSLDKWQIPATDVSVTTILPNNHLILWIDNDFDNLTSQGADHNAGFTLSGDGETFLLIAPDALTIIDSITFPEMAPDISYGRVCDGCPDWQYFNNVTFDDDNFEEQPNDLLFINEIQTQNVSTYDDPENEFDQWFEVFNPNDHQVNLANYYISINGNPLQWQVPEYRPIRSVIPAGGHLLIWCDNDLADDVNHAPFVLPVEGGTIALTGPDGIATIDSYTYGSIPTDQSYGRQQDGSSANIFFTTPTPSVTNQLIIIQPQLLYINELLTANQNGVTDNAGELEDWIEIYNPNNFDVNIGGYYLTDDPERRNQWVIPTSFPDSVIVPANGWLLFWADDDQEQGVLHTSFKLSNNGEYLGFSSPDGFTLVDEIEWEYTAPDTSLGRITDGDAQWILFIESTPEASNNQGTIQVVEKGLNKLHAYPNPANEYLNFSRSLNVTVFGLNGSLIGAFNNINQLDVSEWSPGIYFLRDDSGNVLRVQKF